MLTGEDGLDTLVAVLKGDFYAYRILLLSGGVFFAVFSALLSYTLISAAVEKKEAGDRDLKIARGKRRGHLFDFSVYVSADRSSRVCCGAGGNFGDRLRRIRRVLRQRGGFAAHRAFADFDLAPAECGASRRLRGFGGSADVAVFPDGDHLVEKRA